LPPVGGLSRVPRITGLRVIAAGLIPNRPVVIAAPLHPDDTARRHRAISPVRVVQGMGGTLADAYTSFYNSCSSFVCSIGCQGEPDGKGIN